MLILCPVDLSHTRMVVQVL